jgi:hypothetical protein
MNREKLMELLNFYLSFTGSSGGRSRVRWSIAKQEPRGEE